MPFRTVAMYALLAVSALISACTQGNAASEQAPPAPTVQVSEPVQREIADWDEFTGRFESPQQVGIRARVSGYLEEVHVEDGATVEAGQLLFTLDQRPYEAAYAAAQGRAEQARAQLQQARADLGRAEQLRDADAISQEELEQARTASITARAALAAAQADADAAALDLEYTQIRSPIAGQLSARQADPGDLVQGGLASGEPLITVVQTDPLHFPFYASESIFLRYQRQEGTGLGAPVEVRLQDESEFSLSGEIGFVDNAVQPGTGAILMRAEFDNENGLIRPGMLGTIRVRGSSPYQAMLVPRTAISSDATRRFVFVVDSEGVANSKPVTLGAVVSNLQVVHGLSPDDRVVVGGLQGLRPGTPVQVQPGEIALQSASTAERSNLQPRPAGSARVVD